MKPVETQIIRIVHPFSDIQLLAAAEALRKGSLVAFPTETVYGLGANALDLQAVKEIFKVKGRPADNPLIVHVADPLAIDDLIAGHNVLGAKLLKEFSPGPLTLVMKRGNQVSDLVTAGLDTVAVRIPAHPVARRLIELAGVPVAAPSANRSGRPSPTRAWHVIEDLSGLIPFIIDDGPCEYGLESTVLDLTGRVPVILRPGAITAEDIFDRTGITVISNRIEQSADSSAPRSPGMKYRHYAPEAEIVLAQGMDIESRAISVKKILDNLKLESDLGHGSVHENQSSMRISLFSCSQTRNASGYEWSPLYEQNTGSESLEPGLYYIDYAAEPDPCAAANRLFAALRRFDRAGIDLIIAETLPEQGMGQAFMNRLVKAAGGAGGKELNLEGLS